MLSVLSERAVRAATTGRDPLWCDRPSLPTLEAQLGRPGRRYRTGIDMVEVESVDVVEPSSVDAARAREAGYASVGELLIAG